MILEQQQVRFPAVLMNEAQGWLHGKRGFDELTRATASAVKCGAFRESLLADRVGHVYQLRGARILHGNGPFWGYNLFLTRLVRVELCVEELTGPLTRDAFAESVSSILQQSSPWVTSGDSHRALKRIGKCESIAEIVGVLAEFD